MKVKEMPLCSRPRERLLEHGAKSLSDTELLAIILENGTKSESIIELCNKILAMYELSELDNASIAELEMFKGIGRVKAVKIKALCELSRRFYKGFCEQEKEKHKIKSAKDVFKIMQYEMLNLDREHLIALLLDSKHKVIKKETISVGTLNMSLIHPREVFKLAIKESAHAIIIVHNHPSGNPMPSDEDFHVTKILAEAGKIIGIQLVGHVIIGNNRFHSMREDSMLLKDIN